MNKEHEIVLYQIDKTNICVSVFFREETFWKRKGCCKFTVKYIEQYAVGGYNKISMKDVNDHIRRN